MPNASIKNLKLTNVVDWPEIHYDIWKYCKLCQIFQKYKDTWISKDIYSLCWWWSLAICCVLTLWTRSQKSPMLNQYLLVTVNYFSKKVELFPMRSIKTQLIVNSLTKEVFTHQRTLAYLGFNRRLVQQLLSFI